MNLEDYLAMLQKLAEKERAGKATPDAQGDKSKTDKPNKSSFLDPYALS